MAILFMTHLSILSKLSWGVFIVNSLALSIEARPTLAQVVNPKLSSIQMTQLPSAQPQKKLGGLYVQSETETQVFPLKQTQVKAQVSGNLSRVEVTQIFENPFEETLEAVYVFPLPDEAAVDEMEIKIGDRIIKSRIETREDAQIRYQQAKQQGRTAALLEQERDNIFTQSLANIKPGEQISVTIRYVDQLKFEGGDYEFVFPMVVGPRYIPGQLIPNTPNTDQVLDADRITPPIVGENTNSDHRIQVNVEINAGVEIKNIRSTSHKIITETRGNTAFISLDQSDQIPNKDLILRYQIAGENTRATVLTQADQQGGHFAVYLLPAIRYTSNQIIPKDVIFLMDTSGSQQGKPLQQSKALMKQFIEGLNPQDTFNIIDFANTTNALSETPLTNTPENREKALNYINQLEANGGTELLNGIKTVIKLPSPPSERLRSIVLVTDGYIGNENEVIAEVQNQLKPGNRFYSFGVGSSVNRFLLNRLAEMGRGTAQIVRQDEATEPAVERFFRQINNPILADIQINWQGEGLEPEIYPISPTDLFDNQPLVLFGRKIDRLNGQLKITARTANGDRFEQTLPVNFNTDNSESSGNIAIAKLWGRSKIKSLMNELFSGETKSGVEAVTRTALSYQLLSQYTAFVAVSEEVRVDPNGATRTVEVPIELPEGVSYDGIFGTSEAQERSTASANINVRGISAASGFNYRGQRSPEIAPVPQAFPAPISPQPDINTLRLPSSRLQVIQVDGLNNENTISELNRYLQGVNLPEKVGGNIIFEVVIKDGNVQRIIFDDLSSTVSPAKGGDEAIIIDRIRRSLQSWQPPTDLTGTFKITLQLKTEE